MKRICENGAFLIQGEYYLYNNLWGAHADSGSQCLWLSAFDKSHIAWGTSWNWIGQEHTIKSFAAVVWGWHWGWKTTHTVLPIQLGALRSLRSTWRFNVTHTRAGGMNVTYDIWLSEDPDLGEEDPAGEVMVWLYHKGDVHPIGSRKKDLVIDSVEWQLWEGPHPVSGWPVYSFIRTINTQAETLDLADFFRYLDLVGLRNEPYLLSVEAGAEISAGEGRLETDYYSIDIGAQ